MMMAGDNILNSGGSWGLKYPLIFARIDDQYVIWCRHCGIVFHSIPIQGDDSVSVYETASKHCRWLNGLWSDSVDPEVLAAIDATP